MISLRIEADTADEMKTQLLGLVSMIQQGEAAAAVEKPKATRKPAEPKPEPVVEAPKDEPKKSVFDDDDKPETVAITKAELQDIAMAFGQKHGDDKLEEIIGRYSTTGKFSGIPIEKYPELHIEFTS